MKTASKVFIIISIVFGSIYALVGFIMLFDSTIAPLGVTPIIFSAVLLIVGFNALNKLEEARSHEDLVAIGILTMIFCSFLGGLFMLLIKEEELSKSHKKTVAPAPTPATSSTNTTDASTAKSYVEEMQSEQSEGKICSTCGEKLEEGQIFCGICGTPVKNICSECNTINKSNDIFCRNCGNKLKEL